MKIIIFFAIFYYLIIAFACASYHKDHEEQSSYKRTLRPYVPLDLQIKEMKCLPLWEKSMMNHIGSLNMIDWMQCLNKISLVMKLNNIIAYNPAYKKKKPIKDWDEAYALCVEYKIIPDILQWTFSIEEFNQHHKYDKFQKYWGKKWHFLDFLEDYYDFDWIDIMNS